MGLIRTETALVLSRVPPMDKKLKINTLRKAIRANRISFPAQIPVFRKHDRADLQCKVVLLYFVLGWSCSRIGRRYDLRRQRVQQILNTWIVRAVQMGYLQSIPPARVLKALKARWSAGPAPVYLLPQISGDARTRIGA
jgi:hypothetical protein